MITSKQKQSSSQISRGAFTLVEMLTVVGIIALLVALVTPALVDVIRSTRLNSAGDGLQNRLSLAQQSAVSRSTEVEMRFYKYPDADSDRPSDKIFYAYQVIEAPNGGAPKPISEVYYLDPGIVMSDSEELSPMLQTIAEQKPDENNNFLFVPPTGTGSNVEYAALRFYADGSCKLLNKEDAAAAGTAVGTALAYTVPPLPMSYLTLIEDSSIGATTIPNNFYCMQIDAYTGKVRVYRP